MLPRRTTAAKKLHQVFSGLHYGTFTRIQYVEYESFYAGMIYTLFVPHCSYISMEEASSHGRSDLVIRHKNQIFILELKCVHSSTKSPKELAMNALSQIKERRYADKHKSEGMAVYGVAMIFSKLERNILNVTLKALIY